MVYSHKNNIIHEYHKKSNDKGPDIDRNDNGRSRQTALGERKYAALGKSAAVLIICDLLREKGPTAVKRRFKTQLTAFSL